MIPPHFDGVLFVGFGGPTPGCCERFSPCPGSEAVCFVRAIIGERPGVQARLAEVAAHYTHLGGFSPFNALTLQQAHSVAARLQAQGFSVPVRVGMRYWPPYVRDVLRDNCRKPEQVARDQNGALTGLVLQRERFGVEFLERASRGVGAYAKTGEPNRFGRRNANGGDAGFPFRSGNPPRENDPETQAEN